MGVLPLRRIDVGKAPKSDIVPAILLIVFSIILYWIIIPGQIHIPSQVKSAFLSPAFAPRVFTLFLGLMALVLLLMTLVRLRPGSPTPSIERLNKHGILREEGVVVTILIICFVFALSFPPPFTHQPQFSPFFLIYPLSCFDSPEWEIEANMIGLRGYQMHSERFSESINPSLS